MSELWITLNLMFHTVNCTCHEVTFAHVILNKLKLSNVLLPFLTLPFATLFGEPSFRIKISTPLSMNYVLTHDSAGLFQRSWFDESWEVPVICQSVWFRFYSGKRYWSFSDESFLRSQSDFSEWFLVTSAGCKNCQWNELGVFDFYFFTVANRF